MSRRITHNFISLFVEKNSDGSGTLRLRGRDLFQRISKRITDEDMNTVAYFLLYHSNINKVDLCYNDIGNCGVATLVDVYLCQNPPLEYLNLIGCNIEWQGMERLCSVAENLSLKTLRLTGNKLGTEGGIYAATFLASCGTLQHIDVGDCNLTIGSLMYFLGMLRDDVGAPALKVLDLSRPLPNSYMYQFPTSHAAENIGLVMKSNTILVELHVQKFQFDGHDIELLLIGLKHNKSLLLLDLGYNRMGDMGIELLALWLRTRPPLLGLNVAGNRIKDTGARALSFHLPFSRVRLLDISDNEIKDNGITDILNSIKKPYVLRLFYLWGNRLGQNSLKIMERMLKSGVLVQEQIDVSVYKVDGKYQHAFYPADRYKHKYYCVMDHGCPIELRIKRNRIEHEHAEPRAKINFQFYPRFPEIDETIEPKIPPC